MDGTGEGLNFLGSGIEERKGKWEVSSTLFSAHLGAKKWGDQKAVKRSKITTRNVMGEKM